MSLLPYPYMPLAVSCMLNHRNRIGSCRRFQKDLVMVGKTIQSSGRHSCGVTAYARAHSLRIEGFCFWYPAAAWLTHCANIPVVFIELDWVATTDMQRFSTPYSHGTALVESLCLLSWTMPRTYALTAPWKRHYITYKAGGNIGKPYYQNYDRDRAQYVLDTVTNKFSNRGGHSCYG